MNESSIDNKIRVFVGTMEDQILATQVLEYSIKRHTDCEVDLFPLFKSSIQIPQPKNPRNWPRTPFSFQRFLIPEICRYQGRAIYLDSDMQVFADISRVWKMDMGGSNLFGVRAMDPRQRRPQFSVMLLDCERLNWSIGKIVSDLDEGKLDYHGLMHDMKIANARAAIGSEWNSLETYEAGVTSLIHYTDMQTQPWVSTENPLESLWVKELFLAVESGFIRREDIVESVNQQWVRPSLLYQVDHQIEHSRNLPEAALRLDDEFQAPFRALQTKERASRRVSFARHAYNRFRDLIRV